DARHRPRHAGQVQGDVARRSGRERHRMLSRETRDVRRETEKSRATLALALASLVSRPSSLALALGAAVCSSTAIAKHFYTYTDEKAIVHYTDQKPPDGQDGVKSTLVRTDHQQLIQLREDGTDGDRTMTFVNSAGGSVTIDVAFVSSSNVASQPPLPARIVLPAMSETHALHIGPLDAKAGFQYQLRYSSMPGDFRAQQDAGARYRLPFPATDRFPIAQAFGGKASHRDKQN